MFINLLFKSEIIYYVDQAVFQILGKQQCHNIFPQEVYGLLGVLDKYRIMWQVSYDEDKNIALRAPLDKPVPQPWEIKDEGTSC